jgi:hypothetical protein
VCGVVCVYLRLVGLMGLLDVLAASLVTPGHNNLLCMCYVCVLFLSQIKRDRGVSVRGLGMQSVFAYSSEVCLALPLTPYLPASLCRRDPYFDARAHRVRITMTQASHRDFVTDALNMLGDFSVVSAAINRFDDYKSCRFNCNKYVDVFV